MKKHAIIVAGGKGLRMGSDIPKQFLEVAGLPVLMHTINTFSRCMPGINIILVLPQSQQAFWKELCATHCFSSPVQIADGGETRFHSVKNGLRFVGREEESLVAVHDGVRPFAGQDTIRHAFKTAEETGAAVPVVPCVDSVRIDTPEGTKAADRGKIHLVQTPQVFLASLLHRAYAQDFTPQFTDDASVVESIGHPVTITSGNRENIKITTPFDIMVAQAIAQNLIQKE